jgi:hypothetical protein
MAYLPGFDYDIFISYSHVDDQDNWVELFQQQLEIELSRLVGRMGIVKVWRDRRRLQGNQIFDQTIQEAIKTSALFLALTSKGYLESGYCHQELRWFREKAEAEEWKTSIGDRMRLFNILLTNLHRSRWLKDHEGTSGHPFHDAVSDDQIGYPSPPQEKLFRSQMRQLCESISSTLEVFKKLITARSNTPVSEPGHADSELTVFLADTSDTLETLRTRIENDLQSLNIKIIDQIPPPYESKQHEERVMAEMKRAQISVHLLNQWRGKKISDEPGKSYSQMQAELGLQHATAQMIWVPQTLDSQAIQTIEDTAQRELLTRLENGDRDRSRLRFVREPETQIKHLILDWLDEIRQQSSSVDKHSSALLATDPKDQLHAFELGHILLEHHVETHLTPEMPNPELKMKLWEELVKQVNKLIVVFGKSDEIWVRKRLEDAVQIAINNNSPLKTLAVCFAPPRRKEDGVRFNWRFLQVHHFNLEEARDPRTLSVLLDDNLG